MDKALFVIADTSASMGGQGKLCILENAVRCVVETAALHNELSMTVHILKCSTAEVQEISGGGMMRLFTEAAGKFSFSALDGFMGSVPADGSAVICFLSDGYFNESDAEDFATSCGEKKIPVICFTIGADSSRAGLKKLSAAVYEVHDIANVIGKIYG